jgi:starch-binding outer membrane protein, SusD/RagB family
MKKINLIFLLPVLVFFSCKKGWLDAKPRLSIVTPSTLQDFQALLDNVNYFNINGINSGEISTTDFILTDAAYNNRPSQKDKDLYIWKGGNIFEGEDITDWKAHYTAIYYANVVLEGVAKVERTSVNADAWDNVKGSALFYRAFMYHGLAQVYCKPFISVSASTDLGLILRTESNINLPSKRATVQETYARIIADLM